jgi:hypothetical protein
MSEFQKLIDHMFRQELIRAIREEERKFEEELSPPPGWQGFTGIQGIFDEAGPILDWWDWRNKPKQFTPSEFAKMWSSFTRDQKVNYVLVLIT